MRIVIEAEFDPDPRDDLAEKYGPSGLMEALMPFGLVDIDIEVQPD